ncbi:MAG: crossover junction endodeoxyribonuclease RuvC [Planctomycetota bacterium]|jgi:crossover junction endodeoxyribonuclease RuvC|nr:crossover junction endodeoxyribonuclease RuvC [Planctomycetota bacterium]MDP7132354.1 crossover junction endodeoxyribonuclease RuvC [Planctomycetota bacterium]MDP7248502.1 crossover junction endodeoxyribonuclease RuvC [Planctomycetota bacterium]
MRVLGIDPGTVTCGYGVIDYRSNSFQSVAYGAIRCKPKTPFEERLATIFTGLEEIIEQHKPDCVAIEEAFAGKSIQTALRIGEARGIAILSASKVGLPVSQYPPRLVKKAVVGAGGAHKSQVQKMVQVVLSLPELPKPDDASDALAIAICHCHRADGRMG